MKDERSTATVSLSREVGTLGLLFTAISGMVGSGWLFASLYAAQQAGPAALLSWCIGGSIALLLALIYAELGAMLPVAGALARIPHFSHGSVNSFLAGWLCWIGYVTTAPIEVTAVLDYASNYLPWLTINEGGERVLTLHGIMVAALLLLLFTVINLLGVKWLIRANNTITLWKLSVPFIAPIVLLVVGFKPENFSAGGGFAPNGVSGVLGAVSTGGVMFCLLGFRAAVDLAGEARNPQRTVPMAMIGAILLAILLYMLLQTAFVGVIPTSHLEQGWGKVSEHVAGGPFAAFATLLGLQWLALLLYSDAIVSPAGSGLAYTAATARINYAMSQNRQLPELFARLNRFGVPMWSLVANYVVGMLIFLPFPGWVQLMGFISSTIVLSLAFGPVSLAALRLQAPDLYRPFRLRLGVALSAVGFVFVSLVVYWTGWETNSKVFLVALIGFVVFVVNGWWRRVDWQSTNIKEAAWFAPYLVGMTLISYFGDFGGGKGLLVQGVDALVIAVFSLGVFAAAMRFKLSPEEVAELLEAEDI